MVRQKIPSTESVQTVTMPTAGIQPGWRWNRLGRTGKVETAKVCETNHLWLKWRLLLDTVLQTNKELMPYTVLLWSRWKRSNLAKLWLIANHLKFQKQSYADFMKNVCRPWRIKASFRPNLAQIIKSHPEPASRSSSSSPDLMWSSFESDQQTSRLRKCSLQSCNSSQIFLNVVAAKLLTSCVDQLLTSSSNMWLVAKMDGLLKTCQRRTATFSLVSSWPAMGTILDSWPSIMTSKHGGTSYSSDYVGKQLSAYSLLQGLLWLMSLPTIQSQLVKDGSTQ